MEHRNNIKAPIVSLLGDILPAPIIDTASATITYIGDADLGVKTSEPLWKITRISIIGTITLTEYADGDMLFDNVWDVRGTLKYSR